MVRVAAEPLRLFNSPCKDAYPAAMFTRHDLTLVTDFADTSAVMLDSLTKGWLPAPYRSSFN